VPHSIFHSSVVLIPINYGNTHWAMAAIFPAERSITVYDSLGKCGISVGH
jgi:Ulp1 family protease